MGHKLASEDQLLWLQLQQCVLDHLGILCDNKALELVSRAMLMQQRNM